MCALIASARLCVAASISPFDDRSTHTTESNVPHEHILRVLSLVCRQFVTGPDWSPVAGSLYQSEAPFSSRRHAVVFYHSHLLYYSYLRARVQIQLLQMMLVCKPYVRLIRRTCCRTTCCELGICRLLTLFGRLKHGDRGKSYLLPALCRLFILSRSEIFMAVTSSLS